MSVGFHLAPCSLISLVAKLSESHTAFKDSRRSQAPASRSAPRPSSRSMCHPWPASGFEYQLESFEDANPASLAQVVQGLIAATNQGWSIECAIAQVAGGCELFVPRKPYLA
jgi:hypothetical protein